MKNQTKGLVVNYGEGGYKMGKSQVWNFLRPPPPSWHCKTFRDPPPLLLKSGNFLGPPFSMAKPPPPPFRRAKTLHASPLPVISDQSVGASCLILPPMRAICVADTNMLVSEKPCGPNAKPRRPNAKPPDPTLAPMNQT